jgi:hypothetical protein
MTEVRRSAFLKRGTAATSAESRSSADPNPPILKMFEREDWTLFRTIEELQQKAGVRAALLRRLVLKELGDNALDAGGIKFGSIDDSTYFIEDDGSGLDGAPEGIAELFSIRRPLRSTKLLRLPQRGALGNGVRVVAGAVLASGGSLTIVTRNRRIVLRPETDGSTSVVKVVQEKYPRGTRIEIGFGPTLPSDPEPFAWVRVAQSVAGIGESYQGRSSSFWYDAAHFHELLLACGAQPLRGVVAELDGCTGRKAGEIVAAAGIDRVRCQDVKREQAIKLLVIARTHARPVTPERLGQVGRDAFPSYQYAFKLGTAAIGSTRPQAVIPYRVEAWAKGIPGVVKRVTDDVRVSVLVNRSPITSEVNVWRNSSHDLCLRGSGLSHFCSDAPKKGNYDITLNITTPHCPITSDGKAPNLEPFSKAIFGAIQEDA